MRISPWDEQFERPVLRREERTFKIDPSKPDGSAANELTLCFEELDELGSGVAIDKSRKYIGRYLEGDDEGAPEDLVLGGRKVRLSRYLCSVIANLEAMERPGLDGDEWPERSQPYTFLDWIGAAVKWPSAWREITKWAGSLIKADPGNSLRADQKAAIGTSSAPPSA